MGVIDSVTSALASTESNDRPTDGSRGAYWCDDRDVRIRDVDLEGEPICSNCGEEMRFERPTGRSCAC